MKHAGMPIMRRLPNLVTGFRLAVVPLAIWCIVDGAVAVAFWLVIGAGLSDALDGFLAKRFDAVTQLGTYLDPIADKALLIGVYLSLGHIGQLPIWLVMLVTLRDALIIGGVLLSGAIDLTLKIAPIFVSKVNTLLQVALMAFVLAEPGVGLVAPAIVTGLISAVAATTMISGAQYMLRWMTGFEPVLASGLVGEKRK